MKKKILHLKNFQEKISKPSRMSKSNIKQAKTYYVFIPTSQKGKMYYVFIRIPKKGNAKECSNKRTIVLISHASKVMVKILQVRLQQYMNYELPDVQLDLEKAEEPEINLPISVGSSKKRESSRKTSTSTLLTTPKPLTVWITTNCGQFLKRWE